MTPNSTRPLGPGDPRQALVARVAEGVEPVRPRRRVRLGSSRDLGEGVRQGHETRGPVGQVQPQDGPAVLRDDLGVAVGLRVLELPEGEGLLGDREVVGDGAR